MPEKSCTDCYEPDLMKCAACAKNPKGVENAPVEKTMPDIKEKLVELIAIGGFFSRSVDAEKCVDYLISNGVTIQKWISVEERLPEPGAEVLTYAKMPDVSWADISVAVYNPEIYQPGWKLVTHWMPLPAPPKGE